jgi:hypothetical protein
MEALGKIPIEKATLQFICMDDCSLLGFVAYSVTLTGKESKFKEKSWSYSYVLVLWY